MHNPFDFSQHTVLVTGGSRGIGLEIVRHFLSQGARVICFSRDISQFPQELFQKELTQQTLWLYSVDCTNPDAIQSTLKVLQHNGLAVTLLINNVGMAKSQLALSMSTAFLDDLMRVNVDSVLLMSQHCLNYFKASLKKIVNINSIASLVTMKGSAAYSMSKCALGSLTQALAIEFAEHAIHVNQVIPGLTGTELIHHDSYTDTRTRFAERSLFNRLATTRDISNAVLFLCSEAANYITGSSLCVSAGQEMGNRS